MVKRFQVINICKLETISNNGIWWPTVQYFNFYQPDIVQGCFVFLLYIESGIKFRILRAVVMDVTCSYYNHCDWNIWMYVHFCLLILQKKISFFFKYFFINLMNLHCFHVIVTKTQVLCYAVDIILPLIQRNVSQQNYWVIFFNLI